MINNITKFISHNKKNFHFKKSTSNKVFLIEFNGWYFIHIIFSYLSNYFKNKKNYKIIAYESFELMNKKKQSFFQRVFWKIGTKVGIKTFNIFKSIGVDEYIRPEYNKKILSDASKKYYDLKRNLNNKSLEDLKINNVWIGDLIYDSFLKKFKLSTIKNFNDKKFLNFFYDSIKFFLFWENYIKNNNIQAICGCHEVYLTGIPLRIANSLNIKTLAISNLSVINISKRVDFIKKNTSEYFKIKTQKNILKKDLKKIGKSKINLAGKNILLNQLSGKSRIFYMRKNFYTKKFKKGVKDSKKINVIIFAHNFDDAFHVHGNNIFEDYKRWFYFLEKIIKKTDYTWFIKNHPSNDKMTKIEIQNLCRKFKNIKLIKSDFPNNELINLGINYGLTLYGTVSSEMSYYGMKMINGNLNNPHCEFNFSYTPKSLDDYEKKLLNLKKFKFKINYEELYQYHYIKNKLLNQNIFFENFNKFSTYKQKKSVLYTDEVLKLWIRDFDQTKHKKIIKKLEKFIPSSRYHL